MDPKLWTAYPCTLDFGSSYICADAKGALFRRMLQAGNAGDRQFWPQVAWVMPASAIPSPPIAEVAQ